MLESSHSWTGNVNSPQKIESVGRGEARRSLRPGVVAKTPRGTQSGEAPAWQGATREHNWDAPTGPVRLTGFTRLGYR